MARRVKVITAQSAMAMSSAELQQAYRKQYRQYRENLREAQKRGADVSGFRSFPTPGQVRQGSKSEQARALGSLSSYRAETGTAAQIWSRQEKTRAALSAGGYGDIFNSPKFDQKQFGKFMEKARASWEGGRRTFDSGAAASLYNVMKQGNYSVRMFHAKMNDLLQAVISGELNADNAAVASRSRQTQTIERTEAAFAEWGIR